MKREWSKYQKDIFKFVKSGKGNAIVQAVAGSGKTTTIVEALKHVKGSHIFLAFNKSIAEELKARDVNARTFHSLTFGPVKKVKKSEPKLDKTRLLLKELLNNDFEQMKLYSSFCAKLLGLGKNAGIGIFVENKIPVWMELVAHHDLSLNHEEANIFYALGLCTRLLEESNKSPMIDFDDMLYLTIKDDLTLPKFDFVFVDEAQDTNIIQRMILKKIMKPKSRLIAVGDEKQAIYGFRGADSESMQMIEKEFNCKKLPLTVTYRCPKKVVNFALNYCTVLEAAPDAPEGIFEILAKWSPTIFTKSDLVVCRTMKPLITLGYNLLRNKKSFYILGREFGQTLINLIRSFDAVTIDELETRLVGYRDKEVLKLLSRDEEQKAEVVEDKVNSILFLIESMNNPQTRTILELETLLNSLFTEKSNATILSTIHKAKGLEANRVFWLNQKSSISKWAKKDWQIQQEKNICYVASTRAKKELYLIEAL